MSLRVAAALRALVYAMCLLACFSQGARAAETVYTLPSDVRWIPITGTGVHAGAFEAYLQGKPSDTCGQILRIKFPNGYIYPWHTNGEPGIYTVLKGTLVIGFDKHHLASGEKAFPAGSLIQGLATEPHYGRAVGETIFDVYLICTHR